MRSQSCKSFYFATLTFRSKQGVTHVHKSLKGVVSLQPFLWTWKDIRTIYLLWTWNTVSVVNSQILAVHQLINVRLCVVSMKALEPDCQLTKHETDSWFSSHFHLNFIRKQNTEYNISSVKTFKPSKTTRNELGKCCCDGEHILGVFFIMTLCIDY